MFHQSKRLSVLLLSCVYTLRLKKQEAKLSNLIKKVSSMALTTEMNWKINENNFFIIIIISI